MRERDRVPWRAEPYLNVSEQEMLMGVFIGAIELVASKFLRGPNSSAPGENIFWNGPASKFSTPNCTRILMQACNFYFVLPLEVEKKNDKTTFRHATTTATHAILAMIWFCHLSTGFATKICTYINASGRAQWPLLRYLSYKQHFNFTVCWLDLVVSQSHGVLKMQSCDRWSQIDFKFDRSIQAKLFVTF